MINGAMTIASSIEACCIASGNGPLDQVEAQTAAAGFKALSDPMRLRLLSHIAAKNCEQITVNELAERVGLSQPTVSHHMKKLASAGLVCREQTGRSVKYSLDVDAFAAMRSIIDVG